MSTYINNSIKFIDNTNSTSYNTGALICSGGIGVTGNIQSGGYIGVNSAIGSSTYPLNVTGSALISNYLGINGFVGSSTYPLNVNGIIGFTGSLSYSSISGTSVFRNIGVNGASYSDDSVPLQVSGNGYVSGSVGVGTTPGTFSATINIWGSASLSGSIGVGSYGNYSSGFSVYDTVRTQGVLPHYYTGSLNATSFNFTSDIRIKKDIIDINKAESLYFIKNIEPKRYKYIDTKRGTDTIYGFIAQDLEQIMPELVHTIPDYIPDIYSNADTFDYPGDSSKIIITLRENKLTFDNLDKEVKIKASRNHYLNDKPIEFQYHLTVLEILSDTSFVVEKDLKLELNSNHEIFIYGKQVDDFKYINQDIIYTIAVSALQEFDSQIQAERINDLSLESRLSALESKYLV